MPLDLNEKIGCHFTREEWAVILIGLAHVQMAPKLADIAERLSDQVQHAAAPIGVLTRVLVKNGIGGE